MYISCCLCTFSSRLVVNAKAVSGGIWALVIWHEKDLETHACAKNRILMNGYVEREPLNNCKSDGKVTFARPLLMLAPFKEHVNALEMYWIFCTHLEHLNGL